MNAKQFIASSLCLLTDRFALLEHTVRNFARFMFPEFMRAPLRGFLDQRNVANGIIIGYVFLFAVLFLVQMGFAYKGNKLFPDQNPHTKNFFEDWENLLNYAFVCQVYCIVGYFFLVNAYSLESQLSESGLYEKIGLQRNTDTRLRGIFGAMIGLLIGLVASSGYAVEMKSFSWHYWFMEAGPPNVALGVAGYYYILVNFLLLLFVIWVGTAHFSIFIVAGRIAHRLRLLRLDFSNSDIHNHFSDEHKLRRLLLPISRLVLLSKLFIGSLILNLFTWKTNEQDAGTTFQVSVILVAIIGIWVFALPRYYIQYQIFRIRQVSGLEEYKDLRMPWIVGASALIDFLLVTYLLKALLGDELTRLLHNLFS